MEEAFELESYLPVSYKTQSEQEYMTFLWGAFQSNYAGEKFDEMGGVSNFRGHTCLVPEFGGAAAAHACAQSSRTLLQFG